MLVPWTILKSNHYIVSKKCLIYFKISVILEFLLINFSFLDCLWEMWFFWCLDGIICWCLVADKYFVPVGKFIELQTKFILNVILTRMNLSRVWNLHLFLAACMGLICDYNVAFTSRSILGIWKGRVCMQAAVTPCHPNLAVFQSVNNL